MVTPIKNLQSLYKRMEKTIKTWDTPSGDPTLPAMASTVDGWKKDIGMLKEFAELNTPSIQSAYNAIETAWDNRDKKDEMLKYTKQAYDNLKNVEQDLVVPEPETKSRMKSYDEFVGQNLSNNYYQSDEMADITTIRRHMSAFRATKSGIDPLFIRDLSRQVDGMALRYDSDNILGNMFERLSATIKSLTNVFNINHRAIILDQCDSIISNIEQTSNKRITHASFKSYANADDRSDLFLELDAMDDTVQRMNYVNPRVFANSIKTHCANIKRITDNFYDPKITRLTNIITEHANSMLYAIKSNTLYGTQCTNMLNTISELHEYARTI